MGANATNVALHKPVELVGVFGTGSAYLDPCCLPPLPDTSIITDGILQAGNAFLNGVWWDEQFTGVHNKIVIDLGGTHSVVSFGAMVDDNDMYLLEYRDPAGVWAPGWAIPYASVGAGLKWRSIDLPAPIIATAVRLSGFPPLRQGTDYAYSVSELQVNTIPEPGSFALMGIGLAGLTLRKRFRNS